MNVSRITTPEWLSLEALLAQQHCNPAVWSSRMLRHLIAEKIPFHPYEYPDEPAPGHDFLLVVGDGRMIDLAKVWRKDNAPTLKLAAVPSIWGSGAEASPMATVYDRGNRVMRVDERFLPDYRSIWPEIIQEIPEDLLRFACGDVWAHTLEGFFSHRASVGLRMHLAALIRRMSAQSSFTQPVWFQFSAEAAAAQVDGGAGLLHGIAHTMEPILARSLRGEAYGHARLCSLFAWPVFRLNRTLSGKADALFGGYGLDADRIEAELKKFFVKGEFDLLLPFLQKHWQLIITHPYARTNCTPVRQNHFEQFRKLCTHR